MKWTVHLDGGPRRVNHAAALVGDTIYSFGGYCSSEEYKDWEPIPVHALDTTTYRWRTVKYKILDVVPFQRYGHTVVSYGHKIYMWGGRNNAVACETLSCFDTKTLEWSVPTVSGMVPNAKDGHSACVIKNKMYIFGGFEYITEQYSQEIHCLNLDTMEWKYINPIGQPPSYRDFHTAVAVNNKMYIYGGRGDLNSPYNSLAEVYCQKIHYFDTVEEKWYSLNPLGKWPQGRRSHSAWIFNGYMYMFGGYNGNTKVHFNDLYRYSLKDNLWEQLNVTGSVPCIRRRQACLMHNDKLFLFGGTSPCTESCKQQVNRECDDYEDGDEDDEDVDPETLIDNSDLHVLDYSPTLKTLCIMKVMEYTLDQTGLTRHILMDIRAMTAPNSISRPVNPAG